MAEDEEPMSDNDIPDTVHNRLLGAISNLYKQKRVKAPVRKERSYKVSEFHLTKVGQDDKKKDKIEIAELARVLDKRAGHVKISEQIKDAKQKTRRLPEPLEKPEAERIERSVGYGNVKKSLNRWDAIVHQQRVAEHVTYPLKAPKMKVHNNNVHDFLTTFTTPTELELELAKSIDDELQREQEQEKKENEEFPLSLEEIKEQRSMMARLRAQLSYREAKAARQNRIKSKKYHRIQRKEKMKQQIKDFEELQKTDPEAALKKLETLEKARAQERASLRHRTTGQWARNLAVRAKYNKDARIALAEQLSQSRDLTQKLKADDSDEQENCDDDDDKDVIEDTDNTWLNKEVSEVQQFYNNYKKYWEEEEKKKESQNNTKVEKLNVSEVQQFYNNYKKEKEKKKKSQKNTKVEKLNVVNNFTISDNINRTANNAINHSRVGSNSLVVSRKSDSKVDVDVNTIHENKEVAAHSIKFIVTNKTQDSSKSLHNVANRKPKGCTIEILPSGLVSLANAHPKKTSKALKRKSVKTGGVCTKTGMWSVISVKKLELTPGKKRKLENSATHNHKFSDTGRKMNQTKPNQASKINSELDLDDMFYDVEKRLTEKVTNKTRRLKEMLDNTDEFEDSNKIEDINDDLEESSSLKMRRQKLQINIDEELNETASLNNHNNEHSVKNIIDNASVVLKAVPNSDMGRKSGNIEPNNFFHAKPKILRSEVPSSFADAEDKLDDIEDDVKKDERSMTISEAFACDDVDEEFKQDKEEEIKKSEVEDVNLILPGWGSWGGPNITSVPEHKTRRFITKFPKVFPRKDENKGNVVVNEDKDEKIKPHLVTELPFPFTSVKEYEASIRAPIGSTFLPQSAHRKLIKPTVTTKLGTVIEPMTKDQLVKTKDDWK